MKLPVPCRPRTARVWGRPAEQELAVGGGVTSDFLLYPLFPTFSTVNIYYLYKPKQIPFFFF